MLKPVLIFNSVAPITVAVARSLHRHGIPVTFADIGGPPFPESRAFQEYIQLPDYRTDPNAFVDRLSKLIQEGGYDTLLPCSDSGMVAISPHYHRLASLLYLGCPEPRIMQRVLDKEQTLEAARACGISVPVTHEIPDISKLEMAQSKLHFPVVAKPRSKVDERQHTFKSRYFATFQSLRDAFLLNPLFGIQNLLQEYSPGVGVGVEVLLDQGEPVALFQHRRLKELPFSGGGSVLSISESPDAKLTAAAIRLLRQLEWRGVAMVEFRHDRLTGNATLMEVNGRYWGSLPLAIGAGVDFPFYEWQLARGEKPSVPAAYRVGLRLHWLSGDLRRLNSLFTDPVTDDFPRPSKGKELLTFTKDIFTPSCATLWSWLDPNPAIRDLKQGLKSVVQALRKQVAASIKHKLGVYRYLGFQNSLAYLQIRTRYALGLKRDRPLPSTAGIQSVLFVCHGNKIRSAMAEALFLNQLRNWSGHNAFSVHSAGLISQPEQAADERARVVAKEFGVSLEDHRPQRLTLTLVQKADAIFIMDNFNEARMRVHFPEAMNKVCYLGAYVGGKRPARNAEIPDPNLGTLAEIRACFHVLDACVRHLQEALRVQTRQLQSAAKQGPAGMRSDFAD